MIQRMLHRAVILLVAAIVASPAAGRGATLFGVRAGEYTDVGEPFIGLELNTQVRPDIWFNPNFEYVLVDDGDLVTLNFDFHYDFDVPAPLMVWAGLGPAVVFSDLERGRRGEDDSETDFGLNLLGGVGWQVNSLLPYVQAKALVSDEKEFVIAVGLRF